LFRVYALKGKARILLTAWLGFFLAMAALLILSQKNLAFAMFVGATILGVSTIPERFPSVLWLAVTNPSTVLLAVIVGLIPVIGAILKASGQMDSLVNNMRVGKQAFLMLSPALVGLLPMPGGALLSAPLIERGGEDLPNEKKAGLNVWFRHVLYLVYPLSPDLMISAQAAQVNVYQSIPYLAPVLLFSLSLGYLFFIRDTSGKMDYHGQFSARGLILPLTALLVAPVLDVLIRTLSLLPIEEAATLTGVLASLLIALAIGRKRLKKWSTVATDARPWDFGLTMMGIMVFLNVFKSSGIPQLMENTVVTPELLFAAGFLLGFGTGRIITPAGIIFPIFLTKFGAVPLPTFAIMYFGIFLGYVVTPVHPCVSFSVESFKTGIKAYLKAMLPPTMIAFALSLSVLYGMNLW